ncbi:MAG: hypothetical protein AAGB19_09685 [Cyanobacteria bacterium P01_F01_bin.3]
MTAYSLMNGCLGYLSASEVVASGPAGAEAAVLSQTKTSADLQWLEDAPVKDEPIQDAPLTEPDSSTRLQ